MSALDRLNLATLARIPANVQLPAFKPSELGIGIVHLGVGAFHRAHQAVYTEDATAATPGDWGILGVSLRHADAAEKLQPQDCLYSVETRDEASSMRVVGALRGVVSARHDPARVETALASPRTHIVTLTVTEKGYGVRADGDLDRDDPALLADLRGAEIPATTLGWLMRGLSLRYRAHQRPLTILSCDNISMNSEKLHRALSQFARETEPEVAVWIDDAIRFPNTMVDCVVPATDTATLQRVEIALGLRDAAPVQREAFSQWVIEDSFAGPRPAWDAAGAQIVKDVSGFERLKLHVLNATHSALAYLGLPRGHVYVRQAIADDELVAMLDQLIAEEISPALAPLPATAYWADTKRRFANPNIDHALAQIAEDGSKKLPVRVFPLLIDNARAGRPTRRLAEIVRAWLDHARRPVKDPQSGRLARWAGAGGELSAALDDENFFPAPFRNEASVRAAVMSVT